MENERRRKKKTTTMAKGFDFFHGSAVMKISL